MNRNVRFAIPFVIFFLIAPQCFSLLDREKDIDAYLSSYLSKCGGPGLSCVVVKNGKIVYLKGFGVESEGTTRPMTADSSSAIGSLTKSFTCLAVMQLVEAGKLDLDAPVVRYLPWFRLADKEKSDKITLRFLMSNRSGIPSIDAWMDDADSSDGAIERGVRALSSARMTREVGTSFEYANENFNILGLIISEVSGLPYREYVQRCIFEPLGMSRSSTDFAVLERIGALTGHYLDVNTFVPSPRNYTAMSIPAGHILSCSIRDLGAYLAMMMNWGEYQGRRLLSYQGIEALESPAINMPGLSVEMGGTGEDRQYCMGWMRASIEGYDFILHAGDNGLMGSIAMFDPSRSLGVAILIDFCSLLDPYRFDTSERLCYNVFRLADGVGLSDYGIPRRKDPNLAEGFIRLDEALLRNLAGRYEGGGLSLTASVEGEGADACLIARISSGARNAIQQRGYRLAFITRYRGVGICKIETAPFFARYKDDGGVLSLTMRDITFYPVRAKIPSGFTHATLPNSSRRIAIAPGMSVSCFDDRLIASSGRSRLEVFHVDAGKLDPANFLPEGSTVIASGNLLSESRSGSLFVERAFELKNGKALFIAVAKDDGGGFLIARLESDANDLTLTIQSVLEPALESLDW